MSTNYFIFELGATRLGVPAMSIETVLEPQSASPLPQAPSYLMGLIPFGQEALAVMDLRKFLRLENEAAGERMPRILVLSAPPLRVGVDVDRAIGVIEVADDDVAQVEVLQGGRLKDFLVGEIDDNGQLTGLVDIDALLEGARV